MRLRAWLGIVMGASALCAGCGNDCSEVADLLRQCCAKGPSELRAACEAEAQRLEDDGNADACKNVEGKLAGCKS